MGQYVVVENVYSKIDIYPRIITSDMIFKNEPKEVKSENFYYSEGEKKYEGYTIWKFNENRQMTEFTSLLKNSYKKTTYIYKGEVLVMVVECDIKNNIGSKLEYYYNSNNAIEKKVRLNSHGDTILMNKYFYNQTNSLFPYKVEKYGSISSSNGFEKTYLSGYLLLEYNPLNQIVKIVEYDENEKFESALLFKYNSGFMIQEGISLNQEFRLQTNYIYNRDENDRIIERFEIDDGNQRLDYKNFYTDNLLTKRIYYQNNEISAVELFDYNTHGDIILKSKEFVIRSTKNITSYLIEYDNKGNLLSKEEFLNGDLKYLSNYEYMYD